MNHSIQDILAVACFEREHIAAVLDPAQRSWVRFDPELGYLQTDIVLADGIDGSSTEYSFEPEGHRRLIHHRDRPCRINTYGDSFTLCQQVHDAETWQEYLDNLSKRYKVEIDTETFPAFADLAS